MKKTINFNKGFLPAAIFSCVIIALGIVGFCVKGINLGLDFRPGLIEEVRVANPVAEISYKGPAKVTLDLSAGQMDIIISGTGADNETRSFNFAVLKTVGELANEVNKIADVTMDVKNSSYDSTKLFLNSAVTNQLSSTPIYIYPAGTSEVTTNDIRNALGDAGGNIKQLGTGADASYQIRMGAEKQDNDIEGTIKAALANKYSGVEILKSDFISSKLSKTYAMQALFLLLGTMLCIWIYAAIRFRWDFALGSIIALIHDTLIMFAFLAVFQVEFSTTTIAAVLTIIGYSINDTVVILDRVRSNIQKLEVTKFDEIINQSLSETLSRSLITTITTLFAVVSLYIFTTGTIHDFAWALIIGLISGCYSSIFISSGFISLVRKNWKPEYGLHATSVKKPSAN